MMLMTAPLDWKWLDTFLKASGPKTAAVAFASGAFLLLAYWGSIPPLDPWAIQIASAVLLLTASLALASVVTALDDFRRPRVWLLYWFNNRKDQAHNQKTFETEIDGGRAASLLSHGIVRIPANPGGQQFDQRYVPMRIPDHIWSVLVEHKAAFTYTPSEDGGHPWRRHWMER
jgi:hypothetical protein